MPIRVLMRRVPLSGIEPEPSRLQRDARPVSYKGVLSQYPAGGLFMLCFLQCFIIALSETFNSLHRMYIGFCQTNFSISSFEGQTILVGLGFGIRIFGSGFILIFLAPYVSVCE